MSAVMLRRMTFAEGIIIVAELDADMLEAHGLGNVVVLPGTFNPPPHLQRDPPLSPTLQLLSQEEMAIELGCSHQYVALIERGILEKLRNGLEQHYGFKLGNVTLEDFMDLLRRE